MAQVRQPVTLKPDHARALPAQAGVPAEGSEGCGAQPVSPATVRDVFLVWFAGGGTRAWRRLSGAAKEVRERPAVRQTPQRSGRSNAMGDRVTWISLQEWAEEGDPSR